MIASIVKLGNLADRYWLTTLLKELVSVPRLQINSESDAIRIAARQIFKLQSQRDVLLNSHCDYSN